MNADDNLLKKEWVDRGVDRQYFHKPSSRYVIGEVYEIRQLTQTIKEYDVKLKEDIEPMPGQFAMLWIPRIGEIPLSFADYSKQTARFIISRVGRVTSYIHENISKGSRILLRGPLGKGFTIYPRRNCLLLGGGYGLAPLYYLARILKINNCRLKTLLGFKDSENVFYVNEFRQVSEVYVSTEDGGKGFKGTVIDMLESILEEESFDIVYACGREEMLMRAVQECVKRNIKVEVSLERLIKCGLGICGSCSIEPLGLRVCRDGPVFNGDILLQIEDIVGENKGEEICLRH